MKLREKLITLSLTLLLIISLTACGGGSATPAQVPATTPVPEPSPATEPVVAEEPLLEPEPTPATEDLSAVQTEFTLTAGNYVAGIDIPGGTMNVEAISGTGNLSSSNMFSGGINEMFGIDDGSEWYTETFNNLKLPEGETLSLNNQLTIKLTYTKVTSNFTGRTYDDASAIDLGSGNYIAGNDFPAGIYKIVAKSGTGNLSSDNMFDGGVNEMFGIDNGTGFYNDQFINANLPDGTTLTISGGLSVTLIPAIN